MTLQRYQFTSCALIRDVQDNFAALHPEARTPIQLRRGLIAPTALHAFVALSFTSQRAQQEILSMPDCFDVRTLLRTRRSDHRAWESLRLDAMRWVLRVKACQHWARIAGQLAGACGFPLVLATQHDPFWGAKPVGLGLLGENHLGLLWGEIFAEMQAGKLRPGLGPALPLPFRLPS